MVKILEVVRQMADDTALKTTWAFSPQIEYNLHNEHWNVNETQEIAQKIIETFGGKYPLRIKFSGGVADLSAYLNGKKLSEEDDNEDDDGDETLYRCPTCHKVFESDDAIKGGENIKVCSHCHDSFVYVI